MRIKIIYILTIFVMSGICSCGSSKKIQNDRKVTKVETTSSSIDSLSVIKHRLITEANQSLEDMEVIHIVYDTMIRSPSDSQRIMSKTIYKRSRKNNQQKAEKCDSAASLVQLKDYNIIQTDSVITEKIKERKETTLPLQISKLVIAVSLLIVILLVCYWYARKK